MFSTSGGVQYIRGCLVHQGVVSTSGGGQYIRGYREYIGGTLSTSGDVMSSSWDEYGIVLFYICEFIRDVMSSSERHHEYIGGMKTSELSFLATNF